MKNGKETKIEKFKNYNINYGTVNKKQPKAYYISISTWGEPKKDEDINYGKIVSTLNKEIKQELYNLVSSNLNDNFYEDNIIVNFELKKSGIHFGKRSYLYCEITLFTKRKLLIGSDELVSDINKIINVCINNVLNNNEYFTFYKRKK